VWQGDITILRRAGTIKVDGMSSKRWNRVPAPHGERYAIGLVVKGRFRFHPLRRIIDHTDGGCRFRSRKECPLRLLFLMKIFASPSAGLAVPGPFASMLALHQLSM